MVLYPWKTTTPKRLLHVKLIEPPYTERYVRWCERSEGEIIAFLLLDCVFMGLLRANLELLKNPTANNITYDKIEEKCGGQSYDDAGNRQANQISHGNN